MRAFNTHTCILANKSRNHCSLITVFTLVFGYKHVLLINIGRIRLAVQCTRRNAKQK